jgi:hypothetical protein
MGFLKIGVLLLPCFLGLGSVSRGSDQIAQLQEFDKGLRAGEFKVGAIALSQQSRVLKNQDRNIKQNIFIRGSQRLGKINKLKSNIYQQRQEINAAFAKFNGSDREQLLTLKSLLGRQKRLLNTIYHMSGLPKKST